MKLDIYGDSTAGYKASGESDTEHFELCPFCGSIDIRAVNTHTPSYWTECGNCGAQGPRTNYPKREARSKTGVKRQHEKVFAEAVDLWNTRAA